MAGRIEGHDASGHGPLRRPFERIQARDLMPWAPGIACPITLISFFAPSNLHLKDPLQFLLPFGKWLMHLLIWGVEKSGN
jgi:hypothetical protein